MTESTKDEKEEPNDTKNNQDQPPEKRGLIGDEAGNRVIDNLYIGPMFCVQDEEWMANNGITHVICAEKGIKLSFPQTVTYLKKHINDTMDENILPYLPKFFEFIDYALENGGKVLVCCQMGVSRSASIIVGYLMKTFNYTYEKAFELVHDARSIILPNENFEKQLKLYRKMDFTLNGNTSIHIHYRLVQRIRNYSEDEDDDEICPEEFKQLTSVDLTEFRPKLKHFKWFSQFSQLEHLNLFNTRVLPEVVPYLVKCTLLKSLNLEGTYLTDESMKELIPVMPHLEELHLPHDASGETIELLGENIPQLRELHLGKASILQSDLKKLKPLKNLKLLDLGMIPVKGKFVLSMAKGLSSVTTLTGSRIQQEKTIRKDLDAILKERS
eukprot:gb/GECH01001564.1/.p1 GENE.gb/GECH01001564.1/~~gb/GECH01001564.1/.p1  ORF type:complete len:384 (+),score=91.60 gb/GECH01001564.1/:1-1152(+)